ncbi:MAG: hypothetical protein ACYC1D_05010 [Acidimicrobiales bacterium]
MIECVVNISEGRDRQVIAALSDAAGPCALDVHADPDHHRAVLTLGGPDAEVEQAVRDLAVEVVEQIDLRSHTGAHPRIGALDVVPWVSLAGWPVGDGPFGTALEARDRFAEWAGRVLALPCFCYGPERTLPDVRRQAWADLWPATGPHRPHRRAGAAAVGARPVLVAYNLWLAEPDLATARRLAADLRSPWVRTLALEVGAGVQVSCNLLAPWEFGPAAAFDAVAKRAAVARAELVGLIPAGVLNRIASSRWAELDLDPSRTIEARLEQAGLDGGRFRVQDFGRTTSPAGIRQSGATTAGPG